MRGAGGHGPLSLRGEHGRVTGAGMRAGPHSAAAELVASEPGVGNGGETGPREGTATLAGGQLPRRGGRELLSVRRGGGRGAGVRILGEGTGPGPRGHPEAPPPPPLCPRSPSLARARRAPDVCVACPRSGRWRWATGGRTWRPCPGWRAARRCLTRPSLRPRSRGTWSPAPSSPTHLSQGRQGPQDKAGGLAGVVQGQEHSRVSSRGLSAGPAPPAPGVPHLYRVPSSVIGAVSGQGRPSWAWHQQHGHHWGPTDWKLGGLVGPPGSSTRVWGPLDLCDLLEAQAV